MDSKEFIQTNEQYYESHENNTNKDICRFSKFMLICIAGYELLTELIEEYGHKKELDNDR